jgi:hypothetical protein
VHRLADLHALARGSATELTEDAESGCAAGMLDWWRKGSFATETRRHRGTQERRGHRLAGLYAFSRGSRTEVTEDTESGCAAGILDWWGKGSFTTETRNRETAARLYALVPYSTFVVGVAIERRHSGLRWPSERRTSVISPTSVGERREDAARGPLSALLRFSLCLCGKLRFRGEQ